MKIIKKLLLSLLALFIVIGVAGFIAISSVLYPNVLVSGNGNTTVLCVGDSITYGQGVLFKRKTQTYTYLLSSLSDGEYTVLNYGLSNRTLLSSGNMPYTNEKFYEKSLKEDADIVTIMLGTNDSKEANWNPSRYKQELETFIKTYQNMQSHPTVYVMLPPKIFIDGIENGNCNNVTLVNEVIPIINEVCSSINVTTIDLYTITKDHPEFFDDGLHPNYEGNIVIAKEIYKIIKE